MKLVGLAAFVLLGYFALYAWLRASGEFGDFARYECANGSCSIVYSLSVSDSDWMVSSNSFFVNETWPWRSRMHSVGKKWPRGWAMVWAMWPALKLEVALDRLGWKSLHCYPHVHIDEKYLRRVENDGGFVDRIEIDDDIEFD